MWKNLKSAAINLPAKAGVTYQDLVGEFQTMKQIDENKELASRVLALERLFTDGFKSIGHTAMRRDTFDVTLEQDVRTIDSDIVFKMTASAGCVRVKPNKIARLRIADANFPTSISVGIEPDKK